MQVQALKIINFHFLPQIHILESKIIYRSEEKNAEILYLSQHLPLHIPQIIIILSKPVSLHTFFTYNTQFKDIIIPLHDSPEVFES